MFVNALMGGFLGTSDVGGERGEPVGGLPEPAAAGRNSCKFIISTLLQLGFFMSKERSPTANKDCTWALPVGKFFFPLYM